MMTIRTALAADAPRIAEIKVAGWRTAYCGLMPDDVLASLSVDEQAVQWRQRLIEHPGRVLVAEVGQQVVGYLSAAASRDADPVDPAIGEIYALYVHPDHWRAGVGSALMTAALDTLRRQQFSRVALWVLANNDPAIRFYQAHGFQADGRDKLEPRGNATLHEIAMARTL